ncbi:metal-dependent hydrolase [Erythrobacter donghaensis]|jgi:inner membrane protein|uniref:metal-dependent hydrolase n=1 Tax=Erythrobacter donghaensis TaxID=267135 RepID=UPI0009405FD5|nr:metal-dependent hydrolase [Erythrobacter donghaensis]
MDNLTHSLVGAVMGQAGLKKTTGLAMPALIIGANLPDVDAACFFWLEGTEHLAFRRGITHGPPALVLLPLILAGLLWGWDRWQTRRGTRPEARLPVRFGWLYAMAFIGCLSHPFFDWLNVYGIRLLEPFSSQWFYGDTLFIIDPWLWAMLIASVWWSRRREKAGASYRWPAIFGIVATLGYIGWNWLTTETAFVVYSINSKVPPIDADGQFRRSEIPEAQQIAAPVPIWSGQRELILGEKNRYYVIHPGKPQSPWTAKPITDKPCAWPDVEALRRTNTQLDAFLFWSRAPFATRAPDGSVMLYDARFYDPRARDRFSVALPDVKCEPLP